MTTIGILGAGKLGSTLASLAVHAGYNTLVAGSGDPGRIELVLSVLARGAHATTAEAAARDAEIVVLATPLNRYATLPVDALAGKVVVDAMNYWPPSDGVLPIFEGQSSSRIVADFLRRSTVVKGLSHLGYHELGDDSRPAGAADRRAIALAGDDPDAVAQVAELIHRLGFDPVAVGGLDQGVRFGPGSVLFGRSEPREVVEQLLELRSPSSAT